MPDEPIAASSSPQELILALVKAGYNLTKDGYEYLVACDRPYEIVSRIIEERPASPFIEASYLRALVSSRPEAKRRRDPSNIAVDTPIDMWGREEAKPGIGPRCIYCGSYNTVPNSILPDVESYRCTACKRAFTPQKYRTEVVDWDEAKEIIDYAYVHGYTFRQLRSEFAKKGKSRSTMLHCRICSDFSSNSKDPLQVAKEYDLRFSPYLALDLTGVSVLRNEENRGIAPQPSERARKLPALFAGDNVTTYGYCARIMRVPTNLDKHQMKKVLTEAYVNVLREIIAALHVPGNMIKMVTCDAEPALIAAIRIVLPGKPIQVDPVHVFRKIDAKILPTMRNPRIRHERIEDWKKLKTEIHDIVYSLSKKQFYLRLQILLAKRGEWESDERMVKAVRTVVRYHKLLTTHFMFPDAPRTNNFSENLVGRVEAKITAKKAFGNPDTAERHLTSYVNAMNFTPFRASDVGLNGFSPFQLAGGKTDTPWADITYVGKRRQWKAWVRLLKDRD